MVVADGEATDKTLCLGGRGLGNVSIYSISEPVDHSTWHHSTRVHVAGACPETVVNKFISLKKIFFKDSRPQSGL